MAALPPDVMADEANCLGLSIRSGFARGGNCSTSVRLLIEMENSTWAEANVFKNIPKITWARIRWKENTGQWDNGPKLQENWSLEFRRQQGS